MLDLRHIGGDDRGSCSGSDLVDDTPNQADATFNKLSFPQTSCNNGPSGNMFMSYMDYTDDAAHVHHGRRQPGHPPDPIMATAQACT